MSDCRKLKIHSKYRSGRWDHITVPEIRLEGKWLDALGFKEGCHIKIKSQKNRLIITLNIENRK